MRPDVLMGLLKNLPADSRSLALHAFAQSAFENGTASLHQYQALDFADSGEALDYLCIKGSALGWGSWTHAIDKTGNSVFTVTNSPFAAGYGPSDHPVCAPIVGIIQAAMNVFFGRTSVVTETHCASQGGSYCRFEVAFSS
jgi:predicted hydrocarbon binding protein